MATIQPAGLDAQELFGAFTLSAGIIPAGIATDERSGGLVVPVITIQPSGITTEERFGVPMGVTLVLRAIRYNPVIVLP